MKKITIAVLLALVLIIPFATIVFAQEEVQDNSVPEQIFNKKRTSERIPELKTLYRDQVEAYRQAYKDFTIAKTNYFNVQTLTALEEAVASTRTVMDSRSKVMITYLEFLVATLEDTSGVELSLKQESLKQLNSMVVALRIHREDIALVKDRAGVNNLADSFVPYAQQYEQVVYKAMALIKIGQVQAVYDRAVLTKQEIAKLQESEEVNAVVQAKRERAYHEIERNFGKINSQLNQLNVRINQAKPESFTQSFYERVLEDLEPIFIQLTKALSYLEELLKL